LACSDGGQEVDDQLQKELESAAEQIVAEFQQGMQEVMDNLEKAQMAFDDLSGGRSTLRSEPEPYSTL
jgi:molecular chaperone GrpE (heat shock protein)